MNEITFKNCSITGKTIPMPAKETKGTALIPFDPTTLTVLNLQVY